MRWCKVVLALAVALGTAGAGSAWADRGRGADDLRWRHDAFNARHDGLRPRGDFYVPRASASRHRADLIFHEARPVRVHRGSRRSRSTHLGLHIGVPLYWNWPPPYYAYPPPVVTVAPPPVYIERPYVEPAPRAEGYWYYCYSPDGYYPYVRECPGGWERVSPTPPR